MVAIWFPGLTIPAIKITKGRFLNISLLGVGIVVPPVDITIVPEMELWGAFKLFDTEYITKPIIDVVNAIPQAVWNLCKSTLDSWAEDFYKRRGEE